MVRRQSGGINITNEQPATEKPETNNSMLVFREERTVRHRAESAAQVHSVCKPAYYLKWIKLK
jgi:hypothetical protein